uniref:Uncharacterized protein n=1 Tax=Parascaris equorum TaxID=6256 RepID=A0A914RGT9_PAREQ
MKDYDAQLRVLAKCHHEIDGRRCEVKIPLSKRPSILRLIIDFLHTLVEFNRCGPCSLRPFYNCVWVHFALNDGRLFPL